MPSFDLYKQMYGGRTQGEQRKIDSDNVILHTWNEDIDAKVAWFYNQTRDTEFEVEDGLSPFKSKEKIPIDVKLFEVEYNSLSKDEQPLHLMFKPNFDYHTAVPYYDDEFKKLYKSIFPVGMYFDYPDSQGIYHRYLVVGQYRYYRNQFPTYLALPCTFKMQWIYKRNKYESWCCLKSQNSYNRTLVRVALHRDMHRIIGEKR